MKNNPIIKEWRAKSAAWLLDLRKKKRSGEIGVFAFHFLIQAYFNEKHQIFNQLNEIEISRKFDLRNIVL